MKVRGSPRQSRDRTKIPTVRSRTVLTGLRNSPSWPLRQYGRLLWAVLGEGMKSQGKARQQWLTPSNPEARWPGRVLVKMPSATKTCRPSNLSDLRGTLKMEGLVLEEFVISS